MSKNLLLWVKAKILLLYFLNLVQMVFELSRSYLFQIVSAQNHMLNKLYDFLIELYDVWLFMNEFLNRFPVKEQEVIIQFLWTTSEWIYQLANHLWGNKCLSLGLFNSQNVRIQIKSNLSKCLDHIFANWGFSYNSLFCLCWYSDPGFMTCSWSYWLSCATRMSRFLPRTWSLSVCFECWALWWIVVDLSFAQSNCWLS